LVEPYPDSAQVDAYGWTGANTYFLVCAEDSVSMGGGGGGFGLFVEKDFSRGSTQPSDTYGNPCLCPHPEFEVLNFEAWGFTTHETADAADAEYAALYPDPRVPALRSRDSH
jgi:hypothetical protein